MAARPLSAISDTLNTAINAPLPAEDNLSRLRASYMDSDVSPRESKYNSASPGGSSPVLVNEDKEVGESDAKSPIGKPKKRATALLVYGLVAFVIIILAVILPVYFTIIKPNHSTRSSSSFSNTSTSDGQNGKPTSPAVPITGRDGSTVTTDDGSTFIYSNKFGGFCELSNYIFCQMTATFL
jgi:hypothetical protein